MLVTMREAMHLKNLPRSGWLFAGVSQPESVADHSWSTAILALMLAKAVNLDLSRNGLSEPLDVGVVAQIALVHDLAESVVTDLPKRATVLFGADVKHDAEERALRQVTNGAYGDDFVALWKEYSDRSSPEGRLVFDADKLEMIHQALIYERAGNQNLGEYWHEHPWNYPVSEELYAALVNARRGGVQ